MPKMSKNNLGESISTKRNTFQNSSDVSLVLSRGSAIVELTKLLQLAKNDPKQSELNSSSMDDNNGGRIYF